MLLLHTYVCIQSNSHAHTHESIDMVNENDFIHSFERGERKVIMTIAAAAANSSIHTHTHTSTYFGEN